MEQGQIPYHQFMSFISPFYKSLLAEIPQDAVIEKITLGRSFSAVTSTLGTGVAMSHGGGQRYEFEPLEGKPLREVAHLTQSFDYLKASIGLAALNSFHNQSLQWIRSRCRVLKDPPDIREVLKGCLDKQVLSIGHFPFLKSIEFQNAPWIAEWNPKDGELPPEAVFYLQEKADLLLVTGSSLINKTMEPVLLKKQDHQEIRLLGPSVPFSPSLFQAGVDTLGGLLVLDGEEVHKLLRSGASSELIRSQAVLKMECSTPA